MKQLLYTFRYLINGRVNNVIKIISLTLGLIAGLVLFSKVAFEMSYDTFYPDVERLYQIQRIVTFGGKDVYYSPTINAPLPAAMKDDLKEVENATVTLFAPKETLITYNQVSYREKMQIADSTFFDLLGFQVIRGDKSQLGSASQLYLSQSAARRIFGEEDPLGQSVRFKDREQPVTVAGVFADIPENCHLSFDMVLSFKTITQVWDMEPDWYSDDSFCGYVKLYPGISPRDVEEHIPAMLRNHYNVDWITSIGMSYSYWLKPVTELHTSNPDIRRMILILSLLAFSILFVSAMNYVLISISSLVLRAKSVGIHKCSGASEENIFIMFIYETAALILAAFACSAILILAFEEVIERLMQTSLTGIFAPANLWVTGLVILVLLLTAGILPAAIFSRIPVTQVFRTYTNSKRYWKQSLLFVQFAGIAFIITLLTIIVCQYEMLIHKDMGYTTENIIYTQGIEGATGEQITMLKKEFEQMPQVAKTSVVRYLPIDLSDGNGIMDENGDNTLFNGQMTWADTDFLETFLIPLVAGHNFPGDMDYTQVMVNEAFVRKMNWTDSPIGKTINLGYQATVVGVVKDYHLMTYYVKQSGALEFQETPPLIILPQEPVYQNNLNYHIVLRLHHLDISVLANMTTRLRSILSDNDVWFMDYQSRIDNSYQDARLFRDSILIASLILLAITLLGLIGYTQDEISRRSKEIAIRKINGATAFEILTSIIKDIVITSIPAILLGLAISFITGQQWLQQFTSRITLNIFLFVACGLVVFAIIIICIAWRSWETANDNPVKSLKTE